MNCAVVGTPETVSFFPIAACAEPATRLASTTPATRETMRLLVEDTAISLVEQLEVDALRFRAGLGGAHLAARGDVLLRAARDDEREPCVVEVDRPGGGQRAAAQLVVRLAEGAPRVVEEARVRRGAVALLQSAARVEVEAEHRHIPRKGAISRLAHVRPELVRRFVERVV